MLLLQLQRRPELQFTEQKPKIWNQQEGTQKVNVAPVIAELDAGAEDGTGEIIELWILPATAEVLLACLNETEKETHKHHHASGLWQHLHNLR